MGGIYVDDAHSSDIRGALPLNAIGLTGSAQTPRPAISVNFKSFYLDPNNRQTGIEIADSSLQEGQGMHGNLSRADTYNTIAAFGPDFNTGYTDEQRRYRADPGLHHARRHAVFRDGHGRIMRGALVGTNDVPAVQQKKRVSAASGGNATGAAVPERGR